MGAQGALPVDAAGNPWSGSYVYNSGNLVLDLLYNLMLESTGRLQKCRIYEMTDNKTARSTIAYLIVRDQAHENAYAKALETPRRRLGQDPADPQDQRRALPRGQEAARPGAAPQAVHLQRGQPVRGRQGLPRRRAGTIDGGELTTGSAPEGFPMDIAVERPEEFAPGLDPELLELVQATAELELADADEPAKDKGAKKK